MKNENKERVLITILPLERRENMSICKLSSQRTAQVGNVAERGLVSSILPVTDMLLYVRLRSFRQSIDVVFFHSVF